MNLTEYIQSLPPEIREVVLRLVLFVVALLLIFILRRALTWLILRPLQIITKRTPSEFDDLLVEALIGPMRYVVMALGINLSVTLLNFGPAITQFANLLARSLFIVALFYALYKVFAIISTTPNTFLRFTRVTVSERLLPFVRTFIRVIIVVVAVAILLQEWGFEVSGLVASVGIVGLAFSLAAQDTVSNLFGFTAIVGDRPFDVGDFIVVNNVSGVVEKVGVRSTRIRQLDQSLVSMPNSALANATLLNWSRLAKRRLNMTIGITYATTPDQMRAFLERIRQMLRERERVDADSIIVHFVNFGDSALEIMVICFIHITDWGAFQAEREAINLAIMDIADDIGVSMAFPSRSLYIESWPNANSQQEGVWPTPRRHRSSAPPANTPPSLTSSQPDGETDGRS